MEMMDDMVMMKDGRIIVMTKGEMMPMVMDMTMSNGTKIMMDGTVMMPDGTSRRMADGEAMTIDGNMSKMDDKMQGM